MINLKIDCNEAVGYFGTEGCQEPDGELVLPILTSPSLKLDIENDSFDKATLNKLIKEGRVTVLPEGTFTSSAEEDVFSAIGNSGIQKFVRTGLFGGSFAFSDGGVCFSNALSTLRRRKWGIMFVYSDGRVLAGRTSDNYLVPFKTSFVAKGTTTYNDGSTHTQYTMAFQLNKAGNNLWNSNRVAFNPDDFDALELSGINLTSLEANNITATGLDLAVNIDCDGTTFVPNIDANIVVTNAVTGNVVAATITLTGEKYIVTGLTSGTAYTIDLKDGTFDNVQDTDTGIWYAAKTITVTTA